MQPTPLVSIGERMPTPVNRPDAHFRLCRFLPLRRRLLLLQRRYPVWQLGSPPTPSLYLRLGPRHAWLCKITNNNRLSYSRLINPTNGARGLEKVEQESYKYDWSAIRKHLSITSQR